MQCERNLRSDSVSIVSDYAGTIPFLLPYGLGSTSKGTRGHNKMRRKDRMRKRRVASGLDASLVLFKVGGPEADHPERRPTLGTLEMQ